VCSIKILTVLAWAFLIWFTVGCSPSPENGEGAPGESGSPDALLGILLDMVVIEGEGKHPPFLLDRFEVTHAQFDTYLSHTHRTFPRPADEAWDRQSGRLKKPDLGEYPVVRVTLEESRAYARWAGKRLPTFREWIRAANRRGRSVYPWGSRSPEKYYTNSLSTRLFTTAPVGAFPSGQSEYGAHDLVGNVWEWTDTVPDFWSRESPRFRKSTYVYHWIPDLLPALDTTLKRNRLTLDHGTPIWFPGLLPDLDTRPEKLVNLDQRIPVPYTGRGRLVVGGGFRNRTISNFTLSPGSGNREVAPIVYEELEWGTVSIQLLEPEEWRDDVGFRCVRDIGDREVLCLIRGLAAVRANKRDPIVRMLQEMGRDLVGSHLEGMDPGMDPDLRERVRKLREELGS